MFVKRSIINLLALAFLIASCSTSDHMNDADDIDLSDVLSCSFDEERMYEIPDSLQLGIQSHWIVWGCPGIDRYYQSSMICKFWDDGRFTLHEAIYGRDENLNKIRLGYERKPSFEFKYSWKENDVVLIEEKPGISVDVYVKRISQKGEILSQIQFQEMDEFSDVTMVFDPSCR